MVFCIHPLTASWLKIIYATHHVLQGKISQAYVGVNTDYLEAWEILLHGDNLKNHAEECPVYIYIHIYIYIYIYIY